MNSPQSFLPSFDAILIGYIIDAFSMDDIYLEICVPCNIDYECLAGNDKRVKVRELVAYCRKRELIESDLIPALEVARPRVNWREKLGLIKHISPSLSDTGYYTIKPEAQLVGKTDKYVIKKPTSVQGKTGSSYIAKKFGVKKDKGMFFVKTLGIASRWDDETIQQELMAFRFLVENELDKSQRLSGIAHVSKLLDHGSYVLNLPDGRSIEIPFIVQSFVVGENLVDFLRKNYATRADPNKFEGIQVLGDWFNFARKVLGLVSEVHKAGVVHGDIHPGNIIVDRRGQPYLVDFSHSYLVSHLGVLNDNNQSQDSHLAYSAPQKRARRTSSSTATADDIYSVGGILYLLATGNEPPEPKLITSTDGTANRLETKFHLKNLIVESLSSYNSRLFNECPGVADVIIQCLHYDDTERARHTDDILRVLDNFEYASNPHAKVETAHLSELLKEIATELWSFNSEPTPDDLFRRIFDLNLQQILRMLKDMRGGKLVEITGTRDEILNGFLTYLSVLSKQDRYITCTMPLYWHPNNLGMRGRFLRMNELLARKQAVSIKRVFLVAPEDRGSEYFKEILQSQKELMDDLLQRGGTLATESSNLDVPGLYVGVKELDQVSRKQFFQDHGHLVGIAQKHTNLGYDESVSVIFDTEGADAQIRRIVLWKLQTERARQALTLMQEQFAHSIPLTRYML